MADAGEGLACLGRRPWSRPGAARSDLSGLRPVDGWQGPRRALARRALDVMMSLNAEGCARRRPAPPGFRAGPARRSQWNP